MTTYYYGNIEFGRFSVNNGESTPLAIINTVDEVREFANDAEAEHYYETAGESDNFIGIDSKDHNGVQYELVFKQHRQEKQHG
jgi:hypothetical protein